jgi:hypothetical protein
MQQTGSAEPLVVVHASPLVSSTGITDGSLVQLHIEQGEPISDAAYFVAASSAG